MKMATDNLKGEQQRRMEARKNFIEERVKAIPTDLQALNEASLVSIVKDLHKQLASAEEARYDVEMKIRRQDYEVDRTAAMFGQSIAVPCRSTS